MIESAQREVKRHWSIHSGHEQGGELARATVLLHRCNAAELFAPIACSFGWSASSSPLAATMSESLLVTTADLASVINAFDS